MKKKRVGGWPGSSVKMWNSLLSFRLLRNYNLDDYLTFSSCSPYTVLRIPSPEFLNQSDCFDEKWANITRFNFVRIIHDSLVICKFIWRTKSFFGTDFLWNAFVVVIRSLKTKNSYFFLQNEYNFFCVFSHKIIRPF